MSRFLLFCSTPAPHRIFSTIVKACERVRLTPARLTPKAFYNAAQGRESASAPWVIMAITRNKPRRGYTKGTSQYAAVIKPDLPTHRLLDKRTQAVSE